MGCSCLARTRLPSKKHREGKQGRFVKCQILSGGGKNEISASRDREPTIRRGRGKGSESKGLGGKNELPW